MQFNEVTLSLDRDHGRHVFSLVFLGGEFRAEYELSHVARIHVARIGRSHSRNRESNDERTDTMIVDSGNPSLDM